MSTFHVNTYSGGAYCSTNQSISGMVHRFNGGNFGLWWPGYAATQDNTLATDWANASTEFVLTRGSGSRASWAFPTVQVYENNVPVMAATVLNFQGSGVGVIQSGNAANITVNGGVDTQNQSVDLGTATSINFVGSGVTASIASGTTTVTINGGSGYQTIEYLGSALTQRTTMNFAKGAYVVDDGSSTTQISIDPIDNGNALRNAQSRWIRRNNPIHGQNQYAPVSNVLGGAGVYDSGAGANGAGMATTTIGDYLFFCGCPTGGGSQFGLYGINTRTNQPCNGGAAIANIGPAATSSATYPWDIIGVRCNIDAAPYNGNPVDLIFVVSAGYANLYFITNNSTFSIQDYSTVSNNTMTLTQIYSQTAGLPSSGSAFGGQAVCLGNPPYLSQSTVPYFAIIGRDAHIYLLDSSGTLRFGTNTLFGHLALCGDDDGFFWSYNNFFGSGFISKWQVNWGYTNATTSAGQPVTSGTINVVSTAGFLSSGSVYVNCAGFGFVLVNYTGTTGTSFTGCTTAGSGTIASNAVIYTTTPTYGITRVGGVGLIPQNGANTPQTLVNDGKNIWALSSGGNTSGLSIWQIDKNSFQLTGPTVVVPSTTNSVIGTYLGRAAFDGELLWVPDALYPTSGGGSPQYMYVYAINPRSGEVVYSSGAVSTPGISGNPIMLVRGITIGHNNEVYVTAIDEFGRGNGLGVFCFGRDNGGAHFRSIVLDNLPTGGGGFQLGSATLVAGTVTINTNISISAAATTKIFAQLVTPGGTTGTNYKVVINSGGGPGVASFTITAVSTSGSTVTTDTSTLSYMIVG